MTYAVSYSKTSFTETASDSGSRLTRLMADLAALRASRNERVRARRTALAMSEEARIHAQMGYRRMRYRHMAN